MADTNVPAHDSKVTHHYTLHYLPHAPRQGDPHYVDFQHYHDQHRAEARCFIGERIGYGDCRDDKGNPCPPPAQGQQPGLELHHTHVEFAVAQAVDLAALEKDYPGISNADEIGSWVESGANFRWLCAFHHRGAAGAHTAAHADWEGSQYIHGLISP